MWLRPFDADDHMKTRWLMRSSNGSIWATTYMFTEAEVLSFQCARPVRRLTDDEEQDLAPGSITRQERGGSRAGT